MKRYDVHLGDRDRLNEDLKPLRRKSLIYLIGGAIATVFGIRQMIRSSYIDGTIEAANNVQTEIDKARAVELMEERNEEQ